MALVVFDQASSGVQSPHPEFDRLNSLAHNEAYTLNHEELGSAGVKGAFQELIMEDIGDVRQAIAQIPSAVERVGTVLTTAAEKATERTKKVLRGIGQLTMRLTQPVSFQRYRGDHVYTPQHRASKSSDLTDHVQEDGQSPIVVVH